MFSFDVLGEMWALWSIVIMEMSVSCLYPVCIRQIINKESVLQLWFKRLMINTHLWVLPLENQRKNTVISMITMLTSPPRTSKENTVCLHDPALPLENQRKNTVISMITMLTSYWWDWWEGTGTSEFATEVHTQGSEGSKRVPTVKKNDLQNQSSPRKSKQP